MPAKKTTIWLAALKVIFTDPALLISLCRNIFSGIGFRKKQKIYIALTEHLGDIIAAEPISRYMQSAYPGVPVTWIVNKKYKPLLTDNPAVSHIKTVTSLTEWILYKKWLGKKNVYDLHISGKICDKHGFQLINRNTAGITTDNYFDKGNLLYCFSQTAGITINEKEAPRIYFPATRDPIISGTSKTIVIHTSANIDSKKWHNAGWNNLVQLLDEFYQPDQIIEIGFYSCISADHPKLLRYCGEKDLGSVRSLIENCMLFIGVESGFAHMANALQKDCIILIGRLNNFTGYMPYSGKLMKETGRQIIYFGKPLPEVTPDEAEPEIRLLLQLHATRQNQIPA